jgi:hypothetical protein
MSAIWKYEGQPNVTPKALDMMWSAIHMALYIHYDTQEEFYPQFEANADKIYNRRFVKTIFQNFKKSSTPLLMHSAALSR